MQEIKEKVHVKKKETFLQGILILMFSQILIKIMGLVQTLYLTNRKGFGDRGNAIYMGSYQVYALLLSLSSIGIPTAISKLISEKIAVGDNSAAHKIFKVSVLTFGILGILGTTLLFCGAELISNYWAHGDHNAGVMSVVGLGAVVVGDDHQITIAAAVARLGDGAAVSRLDCLAVGEIGRAHV